MRKIKNTMDTYLHLLGRNKENLTRGIDEVEALKKDCEFLRLEHRETAFNVEWVDGVECRKALIVLELAIRAALAREESRGFHYREDFPDSNNSEWMRTVFLKKKGQQMNVWTENVDMPFMSPKDR